MKFSNKLFIVLGLVALLVGMVATSAFAAETRVVRYANVVKMTVLDDQPAVIRIQGNYTCDFVDVKATISGKAITITADDTKIKYTGHGCDKVKSFQRVVKLGVLVPGIYTIKANPNAAGKGQKILKGFIAPLIPTPQPSAVPVQ